MQHPTRRSLLKAGGVLAASGVAGVGVARPPGGKDHDLRLFSEETADNAMEVVTEDNHAYVATGDGMHVVDWRNPGRPETVAEVDLNDPLADPALSIKDVKVDGGLAALANDTEAPGGIALYDVSDPADPQFLSFYEPEPPSNIHNTFVDGDHAYLTLGEPHNVDNDDDPQRDLVRIFGDAGVEIVDISDPSDPQLASKWLLREEFPEFANAGVNPNHDLYVQDDLLYNAFWDAGVVVHDVSDPTDPEVVAQFGDAPKADEEIRPWNVDEESFVEYFGDVFPLARYYAGEGNAHYVQPSPGGDYVFVGDEKFPNRLKDDPDTEEFGGIRIFDTSDLSDVEQVGYIAPPEADGLRTAHNFDVTNNRLVSSWYNGGVRVHDVTDPSDPEELARYQPDGLSFWTAVQARSFVVGGVYGARSDDSPGGIVVLHDDRGRKRPPGFDGSAPPDDPGMGAEGSDRSARE